MTVGEASSLLVLREGGLELKGRSISERRVQALLVVDVGDKAVDPAPGVVENYGDTVTAILSPQFPVEQEMIELAASIAIEGKHPAILGI